MLDISLFDMLSIEPGLAFSMRGGRSPSDGQVAATTISYLAIPVHANIKMPLRTPALLPYAIAGINIGIVVAAETGSGGKSEDIKYKTASTDFGFDAGAGVDFNGRRIVPFIQFVCYFGVANTVKDPNGAGPVTNSGIEIKGGVKCKL